MQIIYLGPHKLECRNRKGALRPPFYLVVGIYRDTFLTISVAMS